MTPKFFKWSEGLLKYFVTPFSNPRPPLPSSVTKYMLTAPYLFFIVARTTVLDPASEPIVGPRDIIAMNFQNDVQIRHIFSQSKELQIKWLVKHGLLANSMTCNDPNPQCNGRAMGFQKYNQRIDGFRVLLKTYRIFGHSGTCATIFSTILRGVPLFPRVPLFFQPWCEMSPQTNFTTTLVIKKKVEKSHQINQLNIRYSQETI